MEKLTNEVKEIAKRISDIENKRRRLAEFLKSVDPKVRIKHASEKDSLEDLKIVAVDGGIAKKPLHGFDFVMARAVGVLFHYKKGKNQGVKYCPSRFPVPRPYALEALSDLDYAYSSGIIRQKMEVERARECLKEFKPHVLLMDGSIVPHYADRPSRSSRAYRDYESLLREWQALYKECLDSNVLLAGVIEDSRGTKFCELVKSDILSQVSHNLVPELVKILDRTRDTNLLFWVLDQGERSMVFPYSPNPGEHPVLRDFPKEISEGIFSFYLKTAKWDRPVRVDFLGKENLEKIASIMLAISGQHSGYGLPVPIIEADNAAKLSEEEMENFYSHVLSYTGDIPSISRLRREMRPF